MSPSGPTTFLENSSTFRTERLTERYKRKAITPPTRNITINNPVATMRNISRIVANASILPPQNKGMKYLNTAQKCIIMSTRWFLAIAQEVIAGQLGKGQGQGQVLAKHIAEPLILRTKDVRQAVRVANV